MSDKKNPKIFSLVKYFLSGTLKENVRTLLDNGGAQKLNFFSDAVTHCIVGLSSKETDVSDAKDLYEVPAVTPNWVICSAHCNKPLPTEGFLYDPKLVFFGCKMTASQVSQADYNSLWAMVTFYGGTFQSKLTSQCTHLIVSKAEGAKYEKALKMPFIEIVTPDWIVDSINSGRKPEDEYHPRLLIVPEPKEPTPPPPGDLSTAQILGFADDSDPSAPLAEGVLSGQTPPASTQALLEKLKQRMPWNQSTPTTVSSIPKPATPSVMSAPAVPLTPVMPTQTIVSSPQSQQHPPQQVQLMQQAQQMQQVQQQQQIQQQQPPPMQRMVPPQMMMRPQQTNMQQVQQVVPGPQMKQYRLIHRDINAMHQPRLEMAQGQVTLQQPQQQQQQIIQQVQQQGEVVNQIQQMQQTILQGPTMQIQGQQASMQLQQGAGPRPVAWGQVQSQQGMAPPKQVIQLDPQTHAQLTQMDPHQKMVFLHRIHQRQVLMQRQQLQMQQQQQQQVQPQQKQVQQQIGQQQVIQQQVVQQQVVQQQVVQQRPQVQGAGQQLAIGQQTAVGGVPMQMRQQQIIIRGISPQQQTAWIQQQQFIRQQQMLVQQGGQMRQAVPQRVMQQQTATATWIPQQDGAVVPPTQQQIHQMQQLRQQQQHLRLQQQLKQQVVIRTPGQIQQFTQVSPAPGQPAQNIQTEDVGTVDAVAGGGGIVVNNRTKTALANMLSSRLHTGHISPSPSPQSQQQVLGVAADGSAAGQLRLMSAQQRAPQPPPQLTEPQKPVTAGGAMYSPQQVTPQRRTLGNITNANAAAAVGGVEPPQGPKSPARAPLVSPAPVPPVAGPPKPQYYTHNPNLRIPLEKYLIGCVFYIIEYDKSEEPDVDINAWDQIIREHGGEVETNYTQRITHVLCETQKHGIVQQALRDGKRCVTAFWLNDVVSKGSLSVPWMALHFPLAYRKEKPLFKFNMSLTGFEDRSERDRVALMIRMAGGQYRNYFSALTQILVCRKPEGPKYRKAKELNKMVVNVQWLNEVLLGHFSCIQQTEQQKYQQYNTNTIFRVDYSLIPHLMAAWKIPITVTSEAYNSVKNSPPPTHQAKRSRLALTVDQVREKESSILDAVPVINIELLTMESRPWVAITGDQNLEYSKKAKQLGCFLVKSLNKITHLVVCGNPTRTVKLLTCLITCKHVVTETWLTDSAAQNKLLPEGPYEISRIDTDEMKCNVKMVISSYGRNILFKDKIFYMTPSVLPPRRALSEMIEMCGGRVEKQRRSVRAIRELNSNQLTYFVISCFEDVQLIGDIFRSKIDFYSSELIMRAITTQEFNPAPSVYKYN